MCVNAECESPPVTLRADGIAWKILRNGISGRNRQTGRWVSRQQRPLRRSGGDGAPSVRTTLSGTQRLKVPRDLGTIMSHRSCARWRNRELHRIPARGGSERSRPANLWTATPAAGREVAQPRCAIRETWARDDRRSLPAHTRGKVCDPHRFCLVVRSMRPHAIRTGRCGRTVDEERAQA